LPHDGGAKDAEQLAVASFAAMIIPTPLASQVADPSIQAYEFFDCFERWVREKPDQLAQRFIVNAAMEYECYTFAELWRLTRAAADGYRQAGLRKGDRVLIELPTSPGFAAAILGAFYLGVVPAVIAPAHMRSAETARMEWLHHLDLVQPKVVVSLEPPSPSEEGWSEHPGHAHLSGLIHIHPDQLMAGDPDGAGERVGNAEMSYIQFSSGSTGDPKALLLEMEGIVFNLERMARRIPVLPSDRILSWLPVYHDMGLFGTFMLCIYVGGELTLMDPALFSRSPLLWFRVADEFRCTGTVGPPSALAGALSMLERRPPGPMDFSHFNLWLVGAEQVTPNLVRRFQRIMAGYKMPPNALDPVYGMAEITLAATIPDKPTIASWDRVLREPFEHQGLAEAAGDEVPEEQCLEWTACGYPLDDQGMRITNDDDQDLPDRQVGHILLQSPSLYAGFVHGPKFTPRVGEWHDTGDLGYVADGKLYITGRSREVIIKNGRNYAPERLEDLAATVNGVGRGAAFGVFDPRRETETVVLYVEVHNRYLRDASGRDQVRMLIRTALSQAGFAVDQIELVPRRTLALTTSGKIRRGYIRKQHLDQLKNAK
jgi:fatty-acyl-CoA synthase